MKQLLPLLGDVGLGILSIVFVSLYYERTDGVAFVLLLLMFLPDLDALPELMREGSVGASAQHPHDHREGFHKPIYWLFVTGLWWYMEGFLGAVAFTIILLHFLHDSVLTGWGVAWLYPFEEYRIKFFVDERNQNSVAPRNWIRTWNKDTLQKAIIEHGNRNWIDDLYLKPTAVSIIEYSVFAVSLVALARFLLV